MTTLADAATIAIGNVLDGKYEITDILGEGGMGVVYLALHKRLQRMVAVKTLRDEFASDLSLIERFEREARAASAIGHPNIVQVYDAGGEPGGVPYLVMEYLEGQNLGDLLSKSAPLDLSRTIDVCRQVLAGLSAAHGAGILHRDLKPDNIFITTDAEGNELIKILDFGISKFLDATDPRIAGVSGATQAGTLLGTPRYMSPEQACGSPDLDSRTDLWAVTCVLYQCLTGKTPFDGQNYQQLLSAVLQGKFVGLKEHSPDVPMALHELVQRGLAVEKEDRFPDASSFSTALAAIPLPCGETQEEPNLLAAFDNLADRFIQQEQEDSVDTEVPEPLATVVDPSTPTPNRFAPPGSEEEVSLALDIEPEEALASMPPAELRTPAPPVRKRQQSQLITRKEPSHIGATIAKLLVVVLVLAGAGLGYRYYTLGYIIAPTLPPPADLELEILPSRALVFLDGELQDESHFSLVPGQSYQLRITSRGRLELMGTMHAQPGTKFRVSATMSHTIFPITQSLVSETEVISGNGKAPARERIDAARAKFDVFGDCGARLSAALIESIDQDKPATQMKPLPRGLTEECGLTLDLAVETKPAMKKLDDASKALRAGIAGRRQAILEREKSKGASRKVMRARDKSFRKAVVAARRSALAWREVMSRTQAHWLGMEALRVQTDEGDVLHSQVRNLAVSSDAWMRTHLAGKDAKKQRAELIRRFEIASQAATNLPGTFLHSGASDYLGALKHQIDSKPGKDALEQHNRTVEIFNKIRIPVTIAADGS